MMSDSNQLRRPMDRSVANVQITRVVGNNVENRSDFLAVEEPLEIRIGWEADGRRVRRPVSITMRTPGDDSELAVGFLFTEGIIAEPDQVTDVVNCTGGNRVRVELRPGTEVNVSLLERHFYMSSSCGVCGKASLESVHVSPRVRCETGAPVIESAIICRLPATLRSAQQVFNQTGGLHAAALFNSTGELICLREDVGRHNALDKVIGSQFLAGHTPLLNYVLLVSGRASFELVQKAAVAGIPIIAAVGAPSSLAVDLARKHGLTVLGFVRESQFNVYSGNERIREAMVRIDGEGRQSQSLEIQLRQ
jgi:FdhD protein